MLGIPKISVEKKKDPKLRETDKQRKERNPKGQKDQNVFII